MGKLMVKLHLDPKEANLSEVLRKFNLADEEVDPNFGLVSLDPKDDLYAILVDEKSAKRVGASAPDAVPSSNPRIETFEVSKR